MKKYLFRFNTILVLVFLVISSCSVYKRNYREGYQLEWWGQKKQVPQSVQKTSSLNHGPSKNSYAAELIKIVGTLPVATSSYQKQSGVDEPIKSDAFFNPDQIKSTAIKIQDTLTLRKDEPRTEKSNPTYKKKFHPFALGSLIAAIIGIIIPIIGPVISMALAFFALKEINARPALYKGKILSAIVLFFSFMVLMFFIAVFIFVMLGFIILA